MSLELAIQANTAAIAALTEVWGKLASMGKHIEKGVEAGTVTSTSVGTISIPLAKEKAEAKKSAPTQTVPATATATSPATAPVATATESPSDAPAPDYPAVKAAMLRAIKIHGNTPVIALLAETGVEKAQNLSADQYPAFIAQCDALAATEPVAA